MEEHPRQVEQGPSGVPVGTVTFLFTDIEGSTKLVARLRDGYGQLQADHQRLIREAFAVWDGHEIDTQGDAFFIAFRRARDAVSAAVAAQRSLGTHEWPAGTAVRVRMGIHTDEPGVASDRYHGLGVVRAARICAAGHGGQILLSAATRSLIDEDELPGFELLDLGEHRLKDLPRPEHIYQLRVPGLPDEFPPLKTVDEGPLTVAGREGALAEAAHEALAAERRPRLPRLLIALSAVGAAAAAAVAAYLAVGTGGSSAVLATPNSLAAVDPKADRVVRSIPVGDTPASVTLGAGAVWVLNANDGSVSKIDPKARSELARFGVGAGPTDIAVGAGALWVTTAAFTLIRVDPDSKTTTTRTLPRSTNALQNAQAAWVASDGAAVWATGRATAYRASPGTLNVQLRNVNCCNGVALGGGRVWLAADTKIIELDAATGTQVAAIDLGFLPGRLAFGAPYLWVTQPGGTQVWAIDTRKGRIAGSASVGTHPVGVAVGAGAVWVASADGTVSKVDPGSFAVRRFRVGGTPAAVAVGDGAVWVAID